MKEIGKFLPDRPNPDNIKIPVADKDLINYTVAFGVSNLKAFTLWHPEFLDAAGKLNKTGRTRCAQFFTYSKNREYADAYRATLAAFLGKGGGYTKVSGEIDGKRKDNALKSLLNQAMLLVERGDELDAESLKTISDIFRKVGLLKDEVEEDEPPRRYLPERCNSCRYRSFVEGCVKTGQVEDDCLRCRALAVAKEHGFRYDPKDLLDPTDTADDI